MLRWTLPLLLLLLLLCWQVVLSHTPFRLLADTLGNVPVMVSGRGHVVDVARRYGFKKTVTSKHIARLLPTSVPFAHDAGVFGRSGVEGGSGRS